MNTTAIVFERPGEVALRDVALPPPRPGQAQVATHYSTISAGTEGWALQDRFTWQKTPFPCVPGYQRVGVITALGDGVGGWEVGDRVAATMGTWDGNVGSQWGAHAAAANTPASELYRLPEGVDAVDGSGLVVAQVGYNAASRVTMRPGDWGLVYGDGLIGQCAAQAARARGARVILVGRRPERLALAATHSADVAINARAEDVVATVRAHTAGGPAAFVLDTVQTEAAQREYLPLLERGRGQIVYCGFTPSPAWADMALLQQQELTAHFVSGWARDRMEATLTLMAAGKMCLRPLVTHLVPATRGPSAYRMIQEKTAPFLGVTLDWTEARA